MRTSDVFRSARYKTCNFDFRFTPIGKRPREKMLYLTSSLIVLFLACTGMLASEPDPDGDELEETPGERQKLSDVPPQLAEKSLEELVDRIDTDGNKGLSVEEMVDWMVRIEKAQTTKSLRNHFRETDRNSNGYVTLTEFAHTMANTDDRISASMDEVLAYSRPIFNGADSNQDGQLTLKEYAAFMHPELHLHMIDALVAMFLEQFDNNDDGYVSFFEYMSVYMPSTAEERGKNPEWADQARHTFRDKLDQNKDGLLDAVEMRKWVTSDATHEAHGEAKRLLSGLDKDNNGELSHTEALSELDLIAQSKLALNHNVRHDEL